MTQGAQGRFHIRADFAGGHTLDEFGRVMQKRIKYLNETAFQSIHAMAIDALKAIRGVTKVAKPAGIRVNVVPRADLMLGYYTESSLVGGSATERWAARNGIDPTGLSHTVRKKMCIRNRARQRVENNTIGKIVFSNRCHGVPAKAVRIFQFTDKYSSGADTVTNVYLIASTSATDAKKEARMIVFRRVARFAGLAKRAISALMVKTNTRGPADNVSSRVYAKANEVTEKRDAFVTSQNGDGKYALILEDNLRYAKRAVRGEAAAIDMALKKAANKSVGLIRHRCKNLLLPGEIKTPFPEVVRRKSA